MAFKRFWKIGAVTLALGCALHSSAAMAGQYCINEKITKLISYGPVVYFTTDKTCPNWCRLPSTWDADALNRGYSMLLTAISAGKLVSFYWPAAPTACYQLSMTDAPEALYLQDGT